MSALAVRLNLKDKTLQNLATVVNNIKYNKRPQRSYAVATVYLSG